MRGVGDAHSLSWGKSASPQVGSRLGVMMIGTLVLGIGCKFVAISSHDGVVALLLGLTSPAGGFVVRFPGKEPAVGAGFVQRNGAAPGCKGWQHRGVGSRGGRVEGERRARRGAC